MNRFTAQIIKVGINPAVNPPDDILQAIFEQAGRSKSPIPVRGRINDAIFVQTLVKYSGTWRLYINGSMLKASGLSVGDAAEFEIAFDPDPREVPIPKTFIDALKKDKAAFVVFETLTPSRKKEILRYLGSLKSEESLAKNVERVLRHFRGEKTSRMS